MWRKGFAQLILQNGISFQIGTQRLAKTQAKKYRNESGIKGGLQWVHLKLVLSLAGRLVLGAVI